MYRRTLLACVSAPLAGCLGETPTDAGESDPPADELVDWAFDIGADTSAGAEEGPAVSFDSDADRVVVTGVVVVGSSTCKEAAVGSVDYEDGVLRTQVTHDRVRDDEGERPRECTDDISTDSYRLVARFDDGLPERAVAEERDYAGEEYRTERER